MHRDKTLLCSPRLTRLVTETPVLRAYILFMCASVANKPRMQRDDIHSICVQVVRT